MRHAPLFALSLLALAPACYEGPDDLADLAELEHRKLESSTPFVSGKGYPYYRQPTVIKAKNGDILAFAQGRSQKSDDSDIDVVLRSSKDEGKSWSSQEVLIGKGTKDPAKCQSPVVLDDGTILLLYLTNRYVEAEDDRGCREMHKIVSKDHGKTWSKPVNITKQTQKPCLEGSKGRFIDPPPPGHWGWTGLGPVHGIVKKKGPHRGRIVFAARHLDTDSKTYSHVIYSDDGGESWHIGGSVDTRSTEATVVELENGDLMISSRSHGDTNHRIVAISDDGGKTFEPAWVEDQHPEPGGCQASLLRHSADNILFSNPKSTKERTNGTVQRSPDGGLNWTHARGYSPAGHWSGYSDLVKLDDGDIGVIFEHGPSLKKDHADIRFTVVPKSDLGL